MLESVIEEKRKQDENSMQRQMMNYLWMQNGMMQFFPQMNNVVINTEQTP